jgi:DNA-binding transcriptional LysR family regulator
MEQQLRRRLLDGGFKLRHLQLITAIAANGTIGGAAQDLFVTQPVVTRGLREAEDILGVELFVRGPRGVTPTKYGTLLLDHADTILTSLDRLSDGIEHLRSDGVLPIRVGTNMSGSYALLPRTLISLKAVHPGMKVSVVEGTDEDLVELLRHRHVDVLIGRMESTEPEGLSQVHLYDEPIGIMARAEHPVFRMDSPDLDDLASFPWVLPPASAAGSRLGAAVSRVGSWPPANVIECTSILTIRSILHATDSLAPLPMLVGQNDAELRMLPMELDGVSRTLGITYLADAEPNNSVTLFIDHLRGVAEAIDRELADRG